ncbi:MAG: transporter substrate-binding domain-containing protein, partial [Desulfobacterales bacterium]|nr:transporter substrate-binding domain-containing protein [Desulfobacterales bacterium]
YKIGTTRNAAGHQYLLSRGFLENHNVFLENSNAKSVEILFREFVDLESSVELNFRYETNRLGLSNNEVVPALVLFENQGYIAFSPDTPDTTVKKVNSALREVKSAGIIDAVIDKYVKLYQ